MCGIFGAISINPFRNPSKSNARKAIHAIRHRGPDAQVVVSCGPQAILAHARLSIIDVHDRSNQPLSVDGRYHVVFNGEIYNYIEIRTELEQKGRHFSTQGDAEVLLRAYLEWGADCVARFNGMWAFAIYDAQEHSLFCSRDRFGEKPFLYAYIDGELIFGSEVKALLAYEDSIREPNLTAIVSYIRSGVGAQHEATWFERVRRLPAGYCLKFDSRGLSKSRYWRYPDNPRTDISLPDAVEEYHGLFHDSVRLRLRSDVPLGISLSTGLDSSSIAVAMRTAGATGRHCYTAGVDNTLFGTSDTIVYRNRGGSIDERTIAGQFAAELGYSFHPVTNRYDSLIEDLSGAIWHMESGNSSTAVVAVDQLYRAARQDVTVIMEGQGADELLGGYIVSVLWAGLLEEIRSEGLGAVLRSIATFSKDYSLSYSILMAIRQETHRLQRILDIQQYLYGITALLNPTLRHLGRLADAPDLVGEGTPDYLGKVLLRQHSGGLVNLLHYSDALSMRYGLEARLPFLDHRLVEFAWRLPPRLKVSGGVGKVIHRRAMEGALPSYLLGGNRKYGFNVPISRYLRPASGVDSAMADLLLSERCLQREVFDARGLAQMVTQHFSGEVDRTTIIYRILSVELWYRAFMDS